MHSKFPLFSTNPSPARPALTNSCLVTLLPLVAWAATLVGSRGNETEYPVFDTGLTIASSRHLGENRFGSIGVINKLPDISLATLDPVFPDPENPGDQPAMRFRWHFRDGDPEEFAGAFFALRRPVVETVEPDGTPGPVVSLPDFATLDFEQLERTAPPGATRIEAIRVVIGVPESDKGFHLRIELSDAHGFITMGRALVKPGQKRLFRFDLNLEPKKERLFDFTKVAQIALVIEEMHWVDGVINHPSGEFDIHRIALVRSEGLVTGAAEIARLPDRQLAEELARREFETLWRLADAKTGFSWDRTLFPDLLHSGATGWTLAALPYAVERRWISLKEAEDRALIILRWADQDALYHNGPVGAIGNTAGVLYRFLGYWGEDHPATGTRKIDLGRVNAAEASVIDTAIFHYGVAMAAAGFAGDSPRQEEIRDRAANILGRTDWSRLVEPASGRLHLSWKPAPDLKRPHRFAAPAPFGGYFASREDSDEALTLDYWTAEGFFTALFAIGSGTFPVDPRAWYGMIRERRQAGRENMVVSFPGSAFTSLFAVGLLPPGLGPDRGPEWVAGAPAVDWHANLAATFRAHRLLSRPGPLLLPDACELPDTTYHAQGRPALAVDAAAAFTGTVTPFTLEMAVGLGGGEAAAALAEIRRLIEAEPRLWHPLWGLADAWHPDLMAYPGETHLIRDRGAWMQGQKFPLNAGAGLMGLLNYLTEGGVADRAAAHPVIARGLDRIYRQAGPLAE